MQQLHPEIRSLNDQLRPILKEAQELGEKKGKLIESRRQLGGQKNENELVKAEFNNLEPEAMVYKLIGPALVPQDPNDGRAIVDNRLEYINGEIKKVDNNIAELDKKETQLQTKAQEIYHKMQEKQAQIMQHQQQQQT
ncbi:unnamed protein product [Phytomonas sp. Hart1]|nr:unnamed protein product [Phytomonas sp. Hart1]|eukprot:CCW69102.1 unnamed protein product [Phytomonas sp. isolate Hart1]